MIPTIEKKTDNHHQTIILYNTGINTNNALPVYLVNLRMQLGYSCKWYKIRGKETTTEHKQRFRYK